MAEHDGFGWNYGMAVQLYGGSRPDGPMQASLFLGSVQGRYTTWSLSVRF
jgi:hypothetical protein